MTSTISPSCPLSVSGSVENETCCVRNSFTSIAYINGRRIFFDTRYPCIDTQDWWRNLPPSSSSPQNQSVGCPTCQRSGMASLTESVEVNTARHATPLSCNASNAEPFPIPGDNKACCSSISIYPSSRWTSFSSSTLSCRGEDRSMERPPTPGKEQKREEGKRQRIIKPKEDETSLAWGTPLFLVDYTTLWWSKICQRKRCKSTLHFSSSSTPSCVSLSNVSGVENQPIGVRAPAHEDTVQQHSTESLSQEDAPQEGYPCFHVPEEEVCVASSPLPTRATPLTSSHSPTCANHPSPPSSFSSQQRAEQEGDKMSELEDRSEEMRDEEEAFTRLKKALQAGTTTLPPFPVVMMLPTTTIINVSEKTFSAPIPFPEGKNASEMPIGLGLAVRYTSQGNISPVDPSHSLPHATESAEVQCTEATTFPNTSTPPLCPFFPLSTPRPTADGGGGHLASAGLESGRSLLTTVSHVQLQPYHHYHTVAFNPASPPLMAGQWNAAQCIEELCAFQHTSCPSPHHHCLTSSEFSPSSLHHEKKQRSYPLFMWKRKGKKWSPHSSDCSLTDRRSKKKIEENGKEEVTGEEGSTVVSIPQWAQEELKGFSIFRALFSSSTVQKEKMRHNTLDTECNEAAMESVQEKQVQQPLTSCSLSHERLLAEMYLTLSPGDLAYLQSSFVRPHISGSSSCPGSPSLSPSLSELLSSKKLSSWTTLRNMGDVVPCGTREKEMQEGMGTVCSSSSPVVSLPLKGGGSSKEGPCSGCTTSSGAKVEGRRKAKEKLLGDALFRPKKVKLKNETKKFLLELRQRSK